MAKVAVTPGESRFVPPSIEKIVDIKTRLLDITSLVEMLSRIGLLTYYADFLSAQYVRDIIQLIDKNQRYKNRAAQLEQELCRLEASRSQKTSDVPRCSLQSTLPSALLIQIPPYSSRRRVAQARNSWLRASTTRLSVQMDPS